MPGLRLFACPGCSCPSILSLLLSPLLSLSSLPSLPVRLPAFPCPPPELSLMAQYHLRRLLHQRRDRLRIVAAPGRHLAADRQEANLNDVIEGLYLDESRITRVVLELERYVRMHRSIIVRGDLTNRLLNDIEHRVFSLLGLRLEGVAVAEGLVSSSRPD